MPKLEIFRKENGKPPLHPEDEHIVAIATDQRFESGLPQFDLNDHDAITGFILEHCGLAAAEAK
jgi:molybdopterin-guanine dinucleotide biosynthesis protein